MKNTMSKKMLWILLGVCALSLQFGHLFAQSKSSIEIDLLNFDPKKESLPPFSVDGDSAVFITLKNVNRFVYSVTVFENQIDGVEAHPISNASSEFKNIPTVDGLDYLLSSFGPARFEMSDNTKELRKIHLRKNKCLLELDASKEEDARFQDSLLIVLHSVEKQRQFGADSINFDAQLKELYQNRNSLKKADSLILDEMKAKLSSIKIVLQTERFLHGGLGDLDTDRVRLESKINETKQFIAKAKEDISGIDLEMEVFNNSVAIVEKLGIEYNERLEKFRLDILDMVILQSLYSELVTCLFSKEGIDRKIIDKQERVFEKFGRNVNSSSHLRSLCNTRQEDAKQSFLSLDYAYKQLSLVSTSTDHEKAIMASIKAVQDRAESIYTKINDATFSKILTDLVSVYDAINEGNFTQIIRTTIIGDNADFVDYKIVCTPQASLPTGVAPGPRSFDYRVRIRKGPKFDLSTGLLFNVALQDQTFAFETTGPDTAKMYKVVQNKTSSLFVPSVALMLNVYKRNPDKNWHLGGNVGLSARTNGGLLYYVGGVLLLGRSQRLNLCFGAVGGQVDRPKIEYSVGNTFSIDTPDFPKEVPLQTPKPFRIGAYVGFSFNLTGSGTKAFQSQVTGG